MMVNRDILSQHAEEASYFWLDRCQALLEPHYDLDDLHRLDSKIEAHFDGLRIGGTAGWDACLEHLAFEEPGDVFTAAVLAFENLDRGKFNAVTEILECKPEVDRAFISALCWVGQKIARPFCHSFIASNQPMYCRIGLASSSLLRQDIGDALKRFLTSSDGSLRARALKTIGELGYCKFLPFVEHSLHDEDETVRYYAAWSGVLIRHFDSAKILMEIAESVSPFAERSGELVARFLPLAQTRSWCNKLIHTAQNPRVPFRVLAAIGAVDSIPWLLDKMSDDCLSRIAGESFTTIVGVDLAAEDLNRDVPVDFETGPTEDPGNEDVAMDPDENLPWPDVDLISSWWRERSSQFIAHRRYLNGQLIDQEQQLLNILRYGCQRTRRAAAYELALKSPTRPLFNVEARSDQQFSAIEQGIYGP